MDGREEVDDRDVGSAGDGAAGSLPSSAIATGVLNSETIRWKNINCSRAMTMADIPACLESVGWLTWSVRSVT